MSWRELLTFAVLLVGLGVLTAAALSTAVRTRDDNRAIAQLVRDCPEGFGVVYSEEPGAERYGMRACHALER